MDANNWRPTAPGGEPVMDTADWRTQLQPDSRQRIVNKIMETLKRHLPFSGQEGLQELKKIAVRFEEKIYTAATNQSDYLRKISLKMLAMETKSQNTIPTGNGNKPLDPGASHSMPPQVHNQGQSLPISLSTNQPQARQQLSQNMQNSMSSNGVQSSAGLQSAMPSVSSLTQTIPNTVGQNANMQSISGVSQNPVGNSMGQGIPSNMFVNSQRQMPGRQQVVPPQQQQQSQNPQQYLYQQQIQQQLLKQKLQQMQQQQLHQNLMQNQQMQQQQLHQQAPSPMPGDSDKPVSGISSLLNTGNIVHQPSVAQALAPSLAIGTPGISASPLLAEFTSPDGAHGGALTTVSGKSNVTEQPLERLIKAVKSLSPKALSASVGDIGSVVSMIDRIAGSAPGNGSRAAAGEDLVAMTKCRLQARNYITQDGMTGSRKMRRHTSAMPLNVVSSAGSVSDSFKQFTGPETSDLESTATSSVKRPRIEANHALLEEIREINQRLIDTVVDISDEDVDSTAVAATAEGGEGTIVKCSFSAVALSQNLKSQYASAQMSPIQPLRLLVPTNYPSCSPILLDRFPVEVSKEYEDLSIKAKSRFSISLRSLSQPMSLGEIARTWDVCARVVISEHAQQSGGGTFSSKYGSWENCLSAA